MNLQHELNLSTFAGENRRLWQDGRVWWVNCVAIEAGWPVQFVDDLPAARRQRDLILAALLQVW